MGIDNDFIHTISSGKQFKLLCNAACSNAFAEPIEKNISRFDSSFGKPLHGFGSQSLRNVEPSNFATLRVDVEIAGADMFGFDLKQFANTRTRGREKPHHEIPRSMTLSPQFCF